MPRPVFGSEPVFAAFNPMVLFWIIEVISPGRWQAETVNLMPVALPENHVAGDHGARRAVAIRMASPFGASRIARRDRCRCSYS